MGGTPELPINLGQGNTTIAPTRSTSAVSGSQLKIKSNAPGRGVVLLDKISAIFTFKL